MLAISMIAANVIRSSQASRIDNEFKSYAQNFIDKSKGKVKPNDIKNLSITFDKFDEDSDIVGYCLYIPLYPRIVINQDWWYQH